MSILSTLRNTASTFDALNQAVEVTQNNIANASSPGYVRQRLLFRALPFEAGSLPGGVAPGSLQSGRQDFAERNVRAQTEAAGKLAESKSLLADVEQIFDVSGKTGIAADLNALFASFSAWSLLPNDLGARQNAIASMRQVAGSFNAMAGRIQAEAASAEQKTRATVDQANHLVGVLGEINSARRTLGTTDPGMEARMYATLEELSNLVNFSASFESDGTVTVSLGGGYPLLVGERQTTLSVDYSHPNNAANLAALPAARLIANGRDVTKLAHGGRLAALLEFRNATLPELVGGAEKTGELNRLAIAFADRVNQISTAAGGPLLFTYDAANPVRAASTLSVAPGLDARDLVAAGASANDVALALAALDDSRVAADKIDGVNYTGFFAEVARAVGRKAAQASKAADVQEDVAIQARALRTNASGVSLDEEAVQLVAYQRAYEATARLAAVLNEMTEVILTVLR
jgi:flagellar hook-associated protein 1 FlgK